MVAYDSTYLYDDDVGYNGQNPVAPVTLANEVRAAIWNQTFTYEVAALANAQGPAWRDVLTDAGSGQATIQVDDGDLAYATHRNVISFAIGGTIVFAALIESWAQDTRAQGEESVEVRTVQGRGIVTKLEEAIVYPEYGVGRRSPSHRMFGFMNPAYDDSAWAAATRIKKQGDLTTGSPPAGLVPDQWDGSPDRWPDPDAYWVWGANQDYPGSDPPQAVGDNYFRQFFTLAAQTTVRLYLTADDAFEAYFDGMLLQSDGFAFLWQETKYIDIGLVDAGEHLLAFKGTNVVRDSTATNVAGVLWSLIEMEAGGVLGNPIVHSDETVAVLAYPATPPGMTPGHIMEILMEEAQVRGGLVGVNKDFSVATDTGGNTWDEIEIGFDVATTSLLSVLKQLAEQVPFDFTMGPDAFTLHMYLNKGADLTATVFYEQDVNLKSLPHRSQGPQMNTALVRYLDGRWFEVNDAGLSDAWGRQERGVEVGGAPSEDAAARAATAEFTAIGDESVHTVAEPEDVLLPGALPYDGVVLGDIVSCTNPDGVLAALRLLAFTVAQDDVGMPLYTVEG